MYMVAVFTAFAVVAALAGLLMPHLVHRLGFLMALTYLGCAAGAALLNIVRRPR